MSGRYRVAALLGMWWLAGCPVGLAAPALVLKAATESKQTGEYRLQLPVEGSAHVHVQPTAAGGGPDRVDFALSAFKSDGQPPGTIGFVTGSPGAVASYITGVSVPPGGVDLELIGADLSPGATYTGQLSATVSSGQTLVWDVSVVQTGTVPLIVCPHGTQTVAPNTVTALDFRSLVPIGGTPLTVRLSTFSSKDQVVGDVSLAQDLAAFSPPADHFTLPIQVRGLADAVTYSGTVSFLKKGEPVAQCALDIMSPKQAEGLLATDRQSLTEDVMLPFLQPFKHPDRGRPAATFTLSLFDATRNHTVDGISATVDGLTEAPEGTFDLARHVRFALNGTPVPDFAQWNAASGTRRLLPGEQATLRLDFHHLHAGKYAFALRFSGTDTSAASAKVDIVVNVKHHWLWAVFAVIFALVLSVTITSGISNWRERMNIRAKVEALRSGVAGVPESHPSVVFLLAVLEQATALVQKWSLLKPPASVYDHLDRAERVATILSRYRLLSIRIEHLPYSDSVIRFYAEAAEDILQRIGIQALDQATADGIVKDLDGIDSKLANPLEWYWVTLKSEGQVQAQRARAIETQLPALHRVDALIRKLENPPAQSEAAFDAAYWMIRLLLSRRNFPEDVDALITTYHETHRLQDAFTLGDRLAWNRVNEAFKRNRLQIKSVDDPQNLQSLLPLKFYVQFADPGLRESYFVRSVLRYDWSFTLADGKDKEPDMHHEAVLSGARVTQYASFPGTLTVSLTLIWPAIAGAETLSLPTPLTAKILKNKELSLLSSVTVSDFLMMLLVGFVALGTSLPALYLNKPTFGSLSDYIAILVWAIGIDQGKNLLQLMKDVPAPDGPSK